MLLYFHPLTMDKCLPTLNSPTTTLKGWTDVALFAVWQHGPGVRCAFFGRNLHSRMPLDPTHHARLKLFLYFITLVVVALKLCMRVTNVIHLGCSFPLTGWHCKSRPNTEGMTS
jgi:hypothetical protein